jgi:hypothetical protein
MTTRQRLTDAELAAKTRATNRQRAERRRVKLSGAGHVQTVVWLTADTRQRLEAESAATGQTLSKAVDRLLAAALQPAPKAGTPPPAGEPTDPLLIEIRRLVSQGKSWQQIADDLNGRGFQSAKGHPLTKGNLWKLWQREQKP